MPPSRSTSAAATIATGIASASAGRISQRSAAHEGAGDQHQPGRDHERCDHGAAADRGGPCSGDEDHAAQHAAGPAPSATAISTSRVLPTGRSPVTSHHTRKPTSAMTASGRTSRPATSPAPSSEQHGSQQQRAGDEDEHDDRERGQRAAALARLCRRLRRAVAPRGRTPRPRGRAGRRRRRAAATPRRRCGRGRGRR